MPSIITHNGSQWIEFKQSDFFTIEQTIGKFFVCKMTPNLLRWIAKKDINRYENLEEIQRERKISRLKEIREFIYSKEYATFPNSFIISVSNDSEFDTDENKLRIPYREEEAYILDGQHRLFWFKDDESKFEILVSVFIGLDKFHQAMIFANINWEQEKVNKSLVYSLYGFSEERTPELISYSIISSLNKEPTSPWVGKIKILWKWDGTLSLAPFYEKLLEEIKVGVFQSYYQQDKEQFKWFINSDSKLYFVLEDYFNAVKSLFPNEWENKEFILNKTTWFNAFFKLLVDIFNNKSYNQHPYFNQPSIDSFKQFLSNIPANISPLTSTNYPSGATWQSKLYKELKENIKYD